MIKSFLNSDVFLIRRLRKSDQQAFEFIYNKFSERLYFFTRRYLHSSADCDEIIQNVFVLLWENREMVKEEHSLKSFLYKITVNQIYNHLKHFAVRQKYLDHLSTLNSPESDDSHQNLLHRDLQFFIDKLIEEMPERQCIIFKLSRQEGLSNNEIANQLGLSVRSVENQIYRALKFIKAKLREEYQLAE